LIIILHRDDLRSDLPSGQNQEKWCGSWWENISYILIYLTAWCRIILHLFVAHNEGQIWKNSDVSCPFFMIGMKRKLISLLICRSKLYFAFVRMLDNISLCSAAAVSKRWKEMSLLELRRQQHIRSCPGESQNDLDVIKKNERPQSVCVYRYM